MVGNMGSGIIPITSMKETITGLAKTSKDQYTLSIVNLVNLFKHSELGRTVILEEKQNKIEKGSILKGK